MRRAALGLLLAASFLGGLYLSRGPAPTPGAPTAAAQPAGAHTDWSRVGFSDRAHLEEHFRKHGAEFGATTPDEYLHLAQRLRDRPAGDDLLEATRSDGTICRYEAKSGGFIAFDPDGTIRTFFRPNNGEAYFLRQLKREPNRT
ncbi:MAG TPA: hypothetical protein VJN95_00565 [Gemmatimonadales bacterium]|nr:hypothetical protein [Gemmatimonadales bacterium]